DDLKIDRGTVKLRISSQAGAQDSTWDVEALINDLAAHRAGRSLALSRPATLRAHLNHRGDGVKLDRLALETAFLNAIASGDLDRGIVVNGTIDLDQFRRQAGDLIDLGNLEMAGQGRFHGTY